MDTQWVEVFHVTYGNTVVKTVTHYFVFYFFPAFQTLFYQYLRRERECFFCQYIQLFFVVAETRAKTTQSVCSTNDNRITQLFCSTACIFDIFYRFTLDCLYIDFIQFLNEKFTVFCIHDSLNRCSQHTCIIFFENTSFVKSNTTVQSSLSTKRQQNTIRTFFFDDFLYKIRSYRQEVNLICNTF